MCYHLKGPPPSPPLCEAFTFLAGLCHTQLFKHHQSSTHYQNQFSAITKPIHNLTLLNNLGHDVNRINSIAHIIADIVLQYDKCKPARCIYIYTSSSSQKWNKLPPFPSPFPRGITNLVTLPIPSMLARTEEVSRTFTLLCPFLMSLYITTTCSCTTVISSPPEKCKILVADMLMLDGCPMTLEQNRSDDKTEKYKKKK